MTRPAAGLYRGMPRASETTSVPFSRLAGVVAALAVPPAAVFLVLWGEDWLDPLSTLLGVALSVAALAYLVRRHLSILEQLRAQVETLTERWPAATPSAAPPLDYPVTIAGLARAIAELERNWGRRGDELRGLVAIHEAILDASPDPLILIDAARQVTRANTAARELFGSTIEGRDLASVIRHPDVLEGADECLANRRSARIVELDWPGPPERHFSVRFARLPAPIASRDERGGTILLVLRDVSPLKQAERMRADFVANVSHELRTPLSAILGFIETLRGPARDDTAARERFLGIMHEQTQRMARLVRDLLSLSRIEESEHTPPTDAVEIGRIIGSVADTLMIQAKARNVAIELDLAHDLPTIVGDADQLAQVLQNLIDNAIKYAKSNGKVRIVARTASQPPPRVAASSNAAGTESSAWISVAVADDGEGIPREHLPRLTERFYRVDAARSRQLGGTGLGLAIVKHILNRHRGGLTVDSEPGRGSVFTVWLPSMGAPPARSL